MRDKILALENRIAILSNRKKDNGRILIKLNRKLRNLKSAAAGTEVQQLASKIYKDGYSNLFYEQCRFKPCGRHLAEWLMRLIYNHFSDMDHFVTYKFYWLVILVKMNSFNF